WEQAGKVERFIKSDGGIAVEIPADEGTQVLACHNDQNIYMAWIVTGKIAREIASSPQPSFRNDEGNYQDYYGTTIQMVGGDNWYRFYMNSKANTGTSSLREEAKYGGKFIAKSAATKDGAIIEIAIPFNNPGLHVPKD